MFIVKYLSRRGSARSRRSIFVSTLVFFALAFAHGAAQAQWFWTKSKPATVTIDAPEPVRALLESHFQLPEAPVVDETMRAALTRRAKREIGELLATEGYFTPEVTLEFSSPDKLPVLHVEPGPQALVTELDIEFKGDIATDEPGRRARIEKLRAAWSLSVGRPFRSPVWEEAKAVLLSGVASEDYPAASIEESKAMVDAASARVRLSVRLDSGPVFRYGDLAIKGLHLYVH
jgi:translocation and assembly module TamA